MWQGYSFDPSSYGPLKSLIIDLGFCHDKLTCRIYSKALDLTELRKD